MAEPVGVMGEAVAGAAGGRMGAVVVALALWNPLVAEVMVL